MRCSASYVENTLTHLENLFGLEKTLTYSAHEDVTIMTFSRALKKPNLVSHNSIIFWNNIVQILNIR